MVGGRDDPLLILRLCAGHGCGLKYLLTIMDAITVTYPNNNKVLVSVFVKLHAPTGGCTGWGPAISVTRRYNYLQEEKQQHI